MNTLKIFIAIMACCLAFSPSINAGTQSGGGGGECKAAFAETLYSAITELKNFKVKLPGKLTYSDLETKFKYIEIIEKENPLNCFGEVGVPACAYVNHGYQTGQIQLSCGDNSANWLRQTKEYQMKNVIHEVLYWFPEVQDQNNAISTEIANLLLKKKGYRDTCFYSAREAMKGLESWEQKFKSCLYKGASPVSPVYSSVVHKAVEICEMVCEDFPQTMKSCLETIDLLEAYKSLRPSCSN